MNNKKRGFTLIEVLAAMALAAIVTSLLYNILNSNVKMLILGSNQADLQAECLDIREQVDLKVKGADTIKILDPGTFNPTTANPDKSYIYDEVDTTTGKRVVYYKEGSLPPKPLSKDTSKDFSINFVKDNSAKILKYRVEGTKNTTLGTPEVYHIDASARLVTDVGEGISGADRSNAIEIEYDPVELPVITNFTIIGQNGINYPDFTGNGVIDKKKHTIKVKLKEKGTNYKARIVFTGSKVVRINGTSENVLGGQKHYAIDDTAIINDTAIYRVYSGDKYVDYEVILEFDPNVEEPVEPPTITDFTIVGQDGVNYTDFTGNGEIDQNNHTIKVKLKKKGTNYKANIVFTGDRVVRIYNGTENALGGQEHFAIDDAAIINDTAVYRVYSGVEFVDYTVTLEFDPEVIDPVELPLITNFTIIGQDGDRYTGNTGNGVIDQNNRTIKVKLNKRGSFYEANIVYTGDRVVRINTGSTDEMPIGGEVHYAIDDAAIINDTAIYRVYSGDKYVDYTVTLEFDPVVPDTYIVSIGTDLWEGILKPLNQVWIADAVVAKVTSPTGGSTIGGTYTWQVTAKKNNINSGWVTIPYTGSRIQGSIFSKPLEPYTDCYIRCIFTKNGKSYISNVRIIKSIKP